MTLVDRYLGAVRDNLPRAQRDDIIQELEDSLRSRLEDEAAKRGRPLTDSEEAAILRGFGNPMAVAARYRGDERSVTFGRRLIGPELFPTYAKVLTINVAITAVVVAVILIVGGGSLLSSVYGGLVPIAIQFAIVTGIFIVADRRFVSDPDRWDPATLGLGDPGPDYRSLDGLATMLNGPARPATVPYSTSIFDFAVAAVTLAISLSIGLPDSSGTMAAGPGWANLFVPVNVLFALALIGPIITLLRPTWTRFRVASKATFYAAFLILLILSLATGNWIVPGDGATNTPKLVELIGLINSAVRVSIAVTAAITAASLLLELRRLRQMPS